MTTSSPITHRSRTQAPSPTSTRAPSFAPAKTVAPCAITVPSPSSAGGSGSRDAVDRGDSTGCLPTIAPSCTTTPSPSSVPGATSAPAKRLRQALERPHDHRAVPRDLLPVALAARAREEMLALEAQRLVGRDLRDHDVAGARLPLAVALRALPRALLVHRHLPLELHVVEHDHLLRADDGHLPHLVGVEPGEVHVRDLPRREAEVAEDNVLDAGREEVSAERDRLVGLLVQQVQDHGQVVDAERPERVLVLADDSEVL